MTRCVAGVVVASFLACGTASTSRPAGRTGFADTTGRRAHPFDFTNLGELRSRPNVDVSGHRVGALRRRVGAERDRRHHVDFVGAWRGENLADRRHHRSGTRPH